jgi:tRNA threonylcarbamoyladenosine biosynthesis protein TsaB
MKILSIDTSTNTCSVALHDAEHLIAYSELHLPKSHSGSLIVLIKELLQNAQLALADLSAIAISEGPGSYTGLRIGTSTAKGLCFTHDIPLIAVNTLEAMAMQLAPFFQKGTILCPMIDARRMEVYCALFSTDMQVLEQTHPHILTEASFQNQIQAAPSFVYFGNGAEKARQLLNQYTNTHYIPDSYPSAKQVGLLALHKLQNQQFENLAYFEPFYLKDFQPTTPKKTN